MKRLSVRVWPGSGIEKGAQDLATAGRGKRGDAVSNTWREVLGREVAYRRCGPRCGGLQRLPRSHLAERQWGIKRGPLSSLISTCACH